MRVPIFFYKNTCPICGKEGSLVFVDKYDSTTKDPIYYIKALYCANCEHKFFVRWVKYKDKVIPVTACSDDVNTMINNICEYSIKNKRKI